MEITIHVIVNASLERVWSTWTTPEDICQWNFASDDWCCPKAELQLRPGGHFSYRMEAKDAAMGFDFEGEFQEIVHLNRIVFKLGDSRLVRVGFTEISEGVRVEETFETENENSVELQRQGWQAILDNFKLRAETVK
jgi:uncharacterized protein YndB with AHSA1/START domain